VLRTEQAKESSAPWTNKRGSELQASCDSPVACRAAAKSEHCAFTGDSRYTA
jgi:hypothetical protein